MQNPWAYVHCAQQHSLVLPPLERASLSHLTHFFCPFLCVQFLRLRHAQGCPLVLHGDGWCGDVHRGQDHRGETRVVLFVLLHRLALQMALQMLEERKCWPADVQMVELARTIYIRCLYGNFGREITKYTVIYGVYIRFWPTLANGSVSLTSEALLSAG